MTRSESDIIIIDLEASGLDEGSYPIEIAWDAIDGEAQESYLIRPFCGWSQWSSESERVHNITRLDLAQSGIDSHTVSGIAMERLSGKRLFSDAPIHDQRWLNKLMSIRFIRHDLQIDNIRMLWIENMINTHKTYGAVAGAIEKCMMDFSKGNALIHRAGADVQYLKKLHKYIQSKHFDSAQQGDAPEPATNADLASRTPPAPAR